MSFNYLGPISDGERPKSVRIVFFLLLNFDYIVPASSLITRDVPALDLLGRLEIQSHPKNTNTGQCCQQYKLPKGVRTSLCKLTCYKMLVSNQTSSIKFTLHPRLAKFLWCRCSFWAFVSTSDIQKGRLWLGELKSLNKGSNSDLTHYFLSVSFMSFCATLIANFLCKGDWIFETDCVRKEATTS